MSEVANWFREMARRQLEEHNAEHGLLTGLHWYPTKPHQLYNLHEFAGKLGEFYLVQPMYSLKQTIIVCDANGHGTLCNPVGRILTKQDFGWLSMLDLPRPWALCGELTSQGCLMIKDFAVLGGDFGGYGPYAERLARLRVHITRPARKGSQSVALVEMLPAKAYRNFLLRGSSIEGLVFRFESGTDSWHMKARSKRTDQF